MPMLRRTRICMQNYPVRVCAESSAKLLLLKLQANWPLYFCLQRKRKWPLASKRELSAAAGIDLLEVKE